MRTLDGASTRSVMGSRVLKSLREGQPRQVVEGLVVAAEENGPAQHVHRVDRQRLFRHQTVRLNLGTGWAVHFHKSVLHLLKRT